MYALVQFYDNIHYVCKSNTITVKKDITKALYSDGRRYSANVLAKNGKYYTFHFWQVSCGTNLHVFSKTLDTNKQ